MRYAIFSDIHANLRAWEAIRGDMLELEADVLVCLGDIVGYGPLPEEVLTEVRKVTPNIVMGNHDAAAVGMLNAALFNKHAESVIKWTRSRLSANSKKFLKRIPLTIEAEDMLFVHAEAAEPGRFSYIDNLKAARTSFSAGDHHVTFVGHTHRPTVFELDNDNDEVRELAADDRVLKEDQRYIVNVGSVGEPRNPEDVRALYVIYDADSGELFFRRVEFDIEAYRRDLEATSLKARPYFLEIVDHHNALEAELELALMHDMEAPATTGAYLDQYGSGMAQPLHLPKDLSSGDKPRPGPDKEEHKMGAAPVMALWLGLLLLLGIASLFIWKPDDARPAAGPPDTPSSSGLNPLPEPYGPPAPPEAFGPPRLAEAFGPPAPVESFGPPAPIEAFGPPVPLVIAAGIPDPIPAEVVPPDPPSPPPEAPPAEVIAYWRMGLDSTGERLVDSTGGRSLLRVQPGRPVGNLAPDPLPHGGVANESALEIGAWKEEGASGEFALRVDRGFTFEGWFLIDGEGQAVFLAGTRPAEGGSWRLDAIAAQGQEARGSIRFVYDGGGEPISVINNDLELRQNVPHHFAVVWNPGTEEAQSGSLRLYFDGVEIGVTEVPHASISAGPAGEFQIGATANTARVHLDELRFTAAVLAPAHFLNLGASLAAAPPPALMFDIGSVKKLYTGNNSPAHDEGLVPQEHTTWIAADPAAAGAGKVRVVKLADGTHYPTPLVVEFGVGNPRNVATGVHWSGGTGIVDGPPEMEGLFGMDLMDAVWKPKDRLPLGFRIRGLEPGEYSVYFTPLVAGMPDAEIRFATGVIPAAQREEPTRINSKGMHERTYRGQATELDVDWELERNYFKHEVTITHPGDRVAVVVLPGRVPAAIPFLQIVKRGPSKLAVGTPIEFNFEAGSLASSLEGEHPYVASISALTAEGFIADSVKVEEIKSPPPPPPLPREEGEPAPPPPSPPATIGWVLHALVENPGIQAKDFLQLEFQIRSGGARLNGFGIEESINSPRLSRRVSLHRADGEELGVVLPKQLLPKTPRWRGAGTQTGDAPLNMELEPGRYTLRIAFMGSNGVKGLRIDKLRLDFGPR